MRAAQQGAFDGFCGVYSIINCLDLVGMKSRRSAVHSELFVQLTHGLGAAALLAGMREGVEAPDLLRAAKLAFGWLAREHGVKLTISQPYRGEFASRHSFLAALSADIASPDTGMIIHIDLPGRAHWTVAKAVAGGKLLLRDSAGLRELQIDRFALHHGCYRFSPSETLMIRRRK